MSQVYRFFKFVRGAIYQDGYKMDVHDGARFATLEDYEKLEKTVAAQNQMIRRARKSLEVISNEYNNEDFYLNHEAQEALQEMADLEKGTP